MRTKKEIIETMEGEMPYKLSEGIKPYIAIAMEIYANQEVMSKTKALRDLLEETAENLELQLSRLGCCGQGDGKDHRADEDSFGGSKILFNIKNLIEGADKRSLYKGERVIGSLNC